jgi:RNA polymerase sigma-70 factor (ECF subfamily)
MANLIVLGKRGATEGTAEAAEAPAPTQGLPVSTPAEREARLRGLVDQHLDLVARVLRNAGTPEADVDDEVQRTFIVAAKRLDEVRQGAEKSFLVQVALHLAAHARRTLARRREVRAEEAPEPIDNIKTPDALSEQHRLRQMLDRLLNQMDRDLRAVFVLYEFEEMTMAEIADTLALPRGTVASRLRRARAEFRTRVRALEAVPETKGEGVQ